MIKEVFFIVFLPILFCNGCTSPDEKSIDTWKKRVEEHKDEPNQANSDSLDFKE